MVINKKIKYLLPIFLCLHVIFLSCSTMHSYNIYYNAMDAYETATSTKNPNVNLLDNCIEKCSKLLTFYPQSRWVDDVIFLSGKCFFLKEDMGGAETKFKELVNFYPESEYVPEAEVMLGKIALKRDDEIEAERWFSRASRDKSVKEEVDFWLTNSYFLLGRYERSINRGKSYLDSFKTGKYRVDVLRILGDASDSLQRYEEALHYYEMAVPLAEDELEFLIKTGDMHYKIGNIDKAKQVFGSIEPENNEEESLVKNRIALCYEAEEKFEEAIAVLQELDNQESKFHIGSIYEKQLILRSALDAYGEAIEKAPNTEYGREASQKVKAIEEVLRLWEVLGVSDTLKVEPTELDSLAVGEDTVRSDVFGDTTDDFSAGDDTLRDIMQETDTLLQEAITGYSEQSKLDSAQVILDTLLQFKTDTIDTMNVLSDTAAETITDTILTQITDTLVKVDSIVDKASIRMRLAELWLLEFDNPDEALREYNIVIEEYPESEYVPKARYAIAWIEHNIKGDWEGALSRYMSIERDYLDTDYAIAARREIESIEKTEDIRPKTEDQEEKMEEGGEEAEEGEVKEEE